MISTTTSLPTSNRPAHCNDLGFRHIVANWYELSCAMELNRIGHSSYIHITSGRVIRLVDGHADLSVQERVASNPTYIKLEPAPASVQFQWMRRFVDSIEDDALQGVLTSVLEGVGPFRRFKDVVHLHPSVLAQWTIFKNQQMKDYIDSWFGERGFRVTTKP